MPVTIVVGGQFGSEGKGKLCSYLAPEIDLAVRAGGPNSGHTVQNDGAVHRLQQIPSTFLNPDCRLAIAAGAVIDLDILLNEIDKHDVDRRLVVDPQSVVIQADDRNREAELRDRIGSCKTGTGSATARKVMRESNIGLTRDVPQLRPYICSVSELASEYANRGARVLIEGTQGIGLSLHHGMFPYVTSRDTSPGTLCGEVGISPLLIDEIILVLRTFPIRVAGNSGPLEEEMSWREVSQESGRAELVEERTTVTNRIRRVGRFDWAVVERSVRIVAPTSIALNFVDYLNFDDFGCKRLEDLSQRSIHFVDKLQSRLGVPVAFIGTGPEVDELIDLRTDARPRDETKRAVAIS